MDEMMHDSSSLEQQNIEKHIFQIVSEELDVKLENNPIIKCGDATIRPDFYSEENNIIGEIYSHIGSLKPPQKNKMLTDILKMLLMEKVTKRSFRKIIAICDDVVLKSITGKSWAATCFKSFDVEIMKVDIGEYNREILIAAQKRQYR